MNFVPTFGENLKRLRLAAGISQEALAAAAGLRRNGTIAGWEKRDTPPRPESVDKLAKALGISKAELLSGVPTGYEDEQKADTVTQLVTGADDLRSAAEEAALPMSEAKLRHVAQIRALTDDEFASIECELKQLVGRALSFHTGGAMGQRVAVGRKARP